MNKLILALLITTTLTGPLWASGKLKERDYQRRYCAGMALEVVTPSGSRADCLSSTHAIEVDFSKKWAEAIGQSLHYANELGRKAGIVLVCKNTVKCNSHFYRLESTIKSDRLKLPIDVWYCQTSDLTLSDCAFDPAQSNR